MKRHFLLIVSAAIIGLNLTPAHSAVIQNPAQQGPAQGLGDVVYSILPPDLFAQTHDGNWLLLAGQELPADSGLAVYLTERGRTDLLPKNADEQPRLPDARGMFLRGLNLARVPVVDPEGEGRLMGREQADQVGVHNHRYEFGSTRENAARGGAFGVWAWPHTDGRDTNPREPNPGRPEDVETRPKNISLYIYVRIG